MYANRATTEPSIFPGHDGWKPASKPPVGNIDTDPRLNLDDQVLAAASRNTFPIVAQQTKRKDGFGLAAGAGIALLLGAATFFSLSSKREPTGAPKITSTATSLEREPLPIAVPPPAHVQATPRVSAIPVGAVPGQAADFSGMPKSQPLPAARIAPGSAPVLIFDGSASPHADATSAGTDRQVANGSPEMLSVGNAAALSNGSSNTEVRSTRLAEPANTVVQGTLIPAVLETAIDTDVPGYVRAVVSQDVRSFDGSRILIPRSSRLIGEYKGANQAGQRRAFLIWTRLVRPDGVSVALASPATDSSGQAGLTGKVNSHFFSRFGSAILMSVLGGVSNLLTRGGSTVIVSGGSTAASAALQDSNRGPTIKVRQGEPIRVFTARDLIFGADGD